MALVSITRVHLRSRSARTTLPLMWALTLMVRQAARTPGFLGGQLARDANDVLWTVTLWDNEASMRAFRNGGAHRRGMPRISDWFDEAALVHWEQESAELPDWREIPRRLNDQGHFTKLRYPTAAHLNRQIGEPSLSGRQLLIRPRGKSRLSRFLACAAGVRRNGAALAER